MKKFLDNYLLVFIMFMPFLYLYLSYGVKNNIDIRLMGFILISVLFVLAYIYLFANKVKRKSLVAYIIFMLLAIGLSYINKVNTFNYIQNVLTILYFPVLVLFFINYENEWVTQKYISYVYLIFSIILTISYIFRFNIELSYEYKQGFIGLFYGSNVISPIIAILMPIALNYAYKCKSFIVKGLFYITTIVSILFIGTKTVYASLAVYIIMCLMSFFKKKPHIALIIATLLSATVIVLPVIPQYQNYRTEKIYNAMAEDTSLYDIESIDKYLFSYKLSNTRNTFMTINGQNNLYGIIVGNEYQKVGIDIVDILFLLGIFGTILYIGFMISFLSSGKIKGKYLVIFIMMIFASFFQGNIFTNYLVYIFIALLFLLSKNDSKKQEEKILLVSNMYPTKKNKSYGIFVKNVYEDLSLYYDTDKVVIGKHNNKLSKLFAYIYLHLTTIIKMTFNNYDYIYVHFISHSSAGVVFASHFMKGEKIIFNAHGNDIVPDTEIDKKNVARSMKYLKHAYKVVVPSAYYMNILRDEYNVPDKKIVIYPSGGVDLSLFKDLDKNESKEKLGLDKKTNYIGYVSRIEKDKGYDTYINAVAELVKDKKYKNYKYIIVGDGSEMDILTKMIKDNKLEDYIIQFTNLTREELVYLYNSLDLFVYPTKRKSESLGLVGLEAFACSTLSVVSDAKGPASYVENKKNAYVFKMDDVNDLVDKINTTIGLDSKAKDKLIKAASKTASEYDSTKMHSILKKIFK